MAGGVYTAVKQNLIELGLEPFEVRVTGGSQTVESTTQKTPVELAAGEVEIYTVGMSVASLYSIEAVRKL